MTRRDVVGLIGWLAVTAAAAIIGSLATGDMTWYRQLDKPSWTPPGWIFPPVWTTLYALMAVAAWLVWRRGGSRWPLGVYLLQLTCNALWSVLFFGLQRPLWAFIDIIALWLAIVATILAFAPRSRAAAALLVPYALWVSFAALLNGSIVARM